jgi:nicotinate phosphoribosyltransferase
MINAEAKGLESLSVENTPRKYVSVSEDSGLLTDLYELRMGQVYFANNKNDLATFNLFARKLPKNREFLVSAGLEQVVEYLQNIRFSEEEIKYLRSLNMFSENYLGYLSNFKFTGSVSAIPEGRLFFPNEPVIQITAPRIEAQIVETKLLSIMNYQVNVATKAAIITEAAKNTPVVEFGFRRAPDAMAASRAAYIGGCAATSNVAAGYKYGIPVKGTMAHAMIMSFPTEEEAFAAYKEQFPQNQTYLVDTYDTLEGTKRAAKQGKIGGIRLDSGDKLELSKAARKILDDAGQKDAKIFVSDDINEEKIKYLLENNAPIDVWGVGTELVTVKDNPALGLIYKLVEDTAGPKIKLSTGKVTLPGTKQVYRIIGNGKFSDVIALQDEVFEGEQLLKPVIANGSLIDKLPTVQEAQACFKTELAHFRAAKSELRISSKLEALVQQLTEKYGGGGR